MTRLEDRDGPEYATADEERDAAIASDVDAHERIELAQTIAAINLGLKFGGRAFPAHRWREEDK